MPHGAVCATAASRPRSLENAPSWGTPLDFGIPESGGRYRGHARAHAKRAFFRVRPG